MPYPAVYRALVRFAWLALSAACSGAPPVAPAASPTPGTTPKPISAPVSDTCPEPAAPIVVACEDDTRAPDGTASSDGDERLTLRAVGFTDLPGWADDSHAQALAAFLRSCSKLADLDDTAPVGSSRYSGVARDWRGACRAAARVARGGDVAARDAAARRFFERHFRPYAAHGKAGPEGKITGYYVQSLRASRTRGGAYRFPIFARPADLVAIQLSQFIADGRSRRVWGYRESATGYVRPYPVRSSIRERALAAFTAGRQSPDAAPVLLWADDPVTALAVEIEGSGKAQLDTGETVWLAFAGKNGLRGRRTGAIMRALRKLRARRAANKPWSDADVAHYYRITDPREAMVFFAVEPRAGAIGTQQVVLSAGRSLAVDRAVIALSTPVWVSTRAPTRVGGKPRPWRRLLIAQDTGASIVGSVRADVYFGADDTAAAIGRRVNNPGRMWLLLPRALRVGRDS
jgi:membrane-bound lytic murein transglycosylase A